MPAVTLTARLSNPETAAVLADHLALERARQFRQQLIPRCGVIALTAIVCGYAFPHVAPGVRWVPAPLCLVPPAWAWVSERRIARRLARRLSEGQTAKVVKSP